MQDNIDLNAGNILNGSESLRSVGERIYEKIVETASGSRTRAEVLGYEDFIVHITSRIAENLLGF